MLEVPTTGASADLPTRVTATMTTSSGGPDDDPDTSSSGVDMTMDGVSGCGDGMTVANTTIDEVQSACTPTR